MAEESDAETILNNYKRMTAECQQIASKISELNLERDEHRLVVDTLSKLESGRKAFRLIGGILVERTVGEILPSVQEHFEGIKEILVKLDANLASKDAERKAYKERHGIMTQEEREAILKSRARQQQQQKPQGKTVSVSA